MKSFWTTAVIITVFGAGTGLVVEPIAMDQDS